MSLRRIKGRITGYMPDDPKHVMLELDEDWLMPKGTRVAVFEIGEDRPEDKIKFVPPT